MASLIGKDDSAPVVVERPEGRSPFLLIADHGGNAVPRVLGRLGLTDADLGRHIAIDIGVLPVGRGLSAALDATLIHQPYSRLVIDCNRMPGRHDAIPAISDGTWVPGNLDLPAADRDAREAAIFRPYHARIAAEIDRRLAAGRRCVLIALHSFTPVHGDYPTPRPWQIGVLWNRDARLAQGLIAALGDECDLTVGLNEPYGVSDDIDYAVPVHAEARGLIHVEVEIRQDRIASEAGQAEWVQRLARLLPAALETVDTGAPSTGGAGTGAAGTGATGIGAAGRGMERA